MRRITWYRLLAAVALVAPLAGGAQGPQPTVREIASIAGVDVGEVVRHPNGRVLFYTVRDSIFAYDLAAKHRSLVTSGFDGNLSVSRAGDRIAYAHESEDGKDDFIWAMRIDPGSGTAVGPAQRVSTSKGVRPSFSPDGKSIAFAAYDTASSSALTVVPTAGGTERTLAAYHTLIGKSSWSADGEWVFVQVSRNDDSSTSLERVPATGGRSESVLTYPNVAGNDASINGDIAFFRPDQRARTEGRIAYVAASGTRGEFRIPPGSDGVVGSAQTVLRHTTRPSATHLLNVADGTVRDLPPGTLLSGNSSTRAWSPDSRHFALSDSTGGHYVLTLRSADGTQPKRYPVILDPATAVMHWSPDGRLLAYSWDGATTVSVLDPATGKIRIVFSAPEATGFDFNWRPDGQSLVLVKHSVQSGVRHRELYEASLDSTGRKLRDIAAEYCCLMFISDRLLLGGADGDESNIYTVIPTGGGTAQLRPGGVGRRGFPGVSSDGKWLLFALRKNNERRSTGVELLTTGGDSSRTLNLPFDLDRRFGRILRAQAG